MEPQIHLYFGPDECEVRIALTDMLSKLQSRFQERGHGHMHEYSAMELYSVVTGKAQQPTYFEVCGSDGFYARIPWSSAEDALFQFPNPSSTEETGQGLRLLVRNSSNACLNVKSIVEIQFAYHGELGEAVFGTKEKSKSGGRS